MKTIFRTNFSLSNRDRTIATVAITMLLTVVAMIVLMEINKQEVHIEYTSADGVYYKDKVYTSRGYSRLFKAVNDDWGREPIHAIIP